MLNLAIIILGLCLLVLLGWAIFPQRASAIKNLLVTLDFYDYLYLLVIAVFGFLVGIIFYRSYPLATMTSFLALFTLKQFHAWKQKRYADQMIDEFLTVNRMLISELHAGKSVAMAYRSIYQRLVNENNNYNSNMRRELGQWCKKMDAGMSIMEILESFNQRYQDSRIEQFYSMMKVSIENGASLLEVIEMTDRVIKDRLQVEREIAIIVSEKKLEQKILSLAPLFLLFFLQWTAYDFIAPLYESFFGRILMSLALLVFCACYYWSHLMTEVIE